MAYDAVRQNTGSGHQRRRKSAVPLAFLGPKMLKPPYGGFAPWTEAQGGYRAFGPVRIVRLSLTKVNHNFRVGDRMLLARRNR